MFTDVRLFPDKWYNNFNVESLFKILKWGPDDNCKGT